MLFITQNLNGELSGLVLAYDHVPALLQCPSFSSSFSSSASRMRKNATGKGKKRERKKNLLSLL